MQQSHCRALHSAQWWLRRQDSGVRVAAGLGQGSPMESVPISDTPQRLTSPGKHPPTDPWWDQDQGPSWWFTSQAPQALPVAWCPHQSEQPPRCSRGSAWWNILGCSEHAEEVGSQEKTGNSEIKQTNAKAGGRSSRSFLGFFCIHYSDKQKETFFLGTAASTTAVLFPHHLLLDEYVQIMCQK